MCLTLLIDASRSMASKWELAKELSQALSYLALRGGDKVRLFALSDASHVKSRPFGGRASFMELCAFLDALKPSGEAAIDYLVPSLELGARGMSIVISDFLYEGEGERALSSLLFKKQQAALIQVLTKEELEPEFSGALRLVDSETDEAVDLYMDRATLEDYRRALQAFLLRIRANANRSGAAYALVRSDQELMDSLLDGIYASGVIRG